MVKLKVLLGLIGIIFLVWAIGVLTGFWGNPIFSYFWIAGNNLANDLSYLGLGVGAFLIALTVIIYYRNSRNSIGIHFKLDSRKSSENSTKRNGNGLMIKLTVLLGLAGIGFLVWSVGIASGLWGNPVFSYFMIVSNNLANDLSYLGLGVGIFLLALSVFIYYKNIKKEMKTHFKPNSQNSYSDVPKRSGNGLTIKLTALLGLVGTGFLVWGVGIASGLWGHPVFSYFWVASSSLANDLSYLGLGVGAFLITLAVIIYYKNAKTEKFFIVDRRLKQRREEFYYLWEKNQQLINDNIENYPTVVMNGRRSELGKEEMEKIVT
jgi:hypothetical protein